MQVTCEKIHTLTKDPKNARMHGKRNLEAIKKSLETFGQQKPIVVDKNGKVIAGNGTLEAAQALGWEDIQVIRTDLEEKQALAFAIADNRTAELAEWDGVNLAQALADIRAAEDLDGICTGFSAEETERTIQQFIGGGIEDPPPPEPMDDPVTKPGDIWIMGNHRLMCGDSSKSEDMDRLLAGASIHLVNTDPPYNVRVEPRSNNAISAGSSGFNASHNQTFDLARHPGKSIPTTKKIRAKDRFLNGDCISDRDFDFILRKWCAQISRALNPGHSFYIWGGFSNWKNYCSAISENNLYFSHGIIWVKEHPVLLRKDFMTNFECCWYGWKEGAAHRFFGPTNVTDVWSVKKVNPQNMCHLTEKPVELAARAIQYSSKEGENVLDLFGGSGSTMMACEQLNRHGFLMEIDPPYCDVIKTRWETFTGKKAELQHG